MDDCYQGVGQYVGVLVGIGTVGVMYGEVGLGVIVAVNVEVGGINVGDGVPVGYTGAI